ncbi:MAG: DUF559 domain-containing protein [Cyclobacteriaceae bacterium]|nr:DUF559 domain-containing protein [Cyclobacteriaceae bacterium]
MSKKRNKIIPYRNDLKEKARELRKHGTLSEVLLWQELKNKRLGYQFHRQVPMLDYIVDFYCHELMLAIEIDGESHEHSVDYDDIRQKRLEQEGVRFFRVDDKDVKRNIDWVIKELIFIISDLERN